MVTLLVETFSVKDKLKKNFSKDLLFLKNNNFYIFSLFLEKFVILGKKMKFCPSLSNWSRLMILPQKFTKFENFNFRCERINDRKIV